MLDDRKPGSYDQSIRVKFTGKGGRLENSYAWSRQLPGTSNTWGCCKFIFDPDASEYDWLVVYDDLAPVFHSGKHHTRRVETLACPREHTLLITAEPSSIKIYGKDFVSQFGCVLTSQESWAISHPHTIFSQPALHWFYGIPNNGDRAAVLDYDALKNMPPIDKGGTISTVTSSKQMGHTLHRSRYNFIQQLKAGMPELEVFGHGINPVVDKAEGIDRFRYHIAIENHVCKHHWTEKLADAFLGYTLPFYHGCPNAPDYFPRDSFIPIDITDPDRSVRVIRDAVRNGEYEKRLPDIIRSRQLVLEKYNLFAVLSQEIQKRHKAGRPAGNNEKISSRHALHRNLPGGLRYIAEIIRVTASRLMQVK